MNPIHVEEYNGHIIEIYQDEYAENPRTNYDMFGKLWIWGKYQHLSDENINFNSVGEAEKYFHDKKCIALPVYAYIHSGITINTSGFSCPWDSGKIGFIFIERENILKEFQSKKLTKELEMKTNHILQSEIEQLNEYLMGYCYGYIVKKSMEEYEEELYSCWGFVNTIETLIDFIKNDVIGEINHATK